MASAFELALGLYQGRIQPTNWTPEQGDYVYCLGHDLPGQVVRLSFGADEHRISQSIDITGLQLIRLVVHERGPATMPPGQSWTLDGQIDAALTGGFTHIVEPGRERTRYDLAIDVHDLTGSHDIDLVLLASGSGVDEAELPGVYIDALQLVTTEPDRPTVFNRDPEPSDRGVDPSQAITFALADLRGVGLDANYDVYVDGVLAISAGVLQSPWDTSGSTLTPRATGFDVSLVPATPWESLSQHTVRVVASADGLASSDTSWSFIIADYTPPQLLSAFAPSETTVRLTFNEALGDGASSAANYTITLISGAPAVTPIVTSAVIEASGIVLLTLDKAQTPLAIYAVTITDVEDVFGNVIAAPYNVTQWTGYECPKPPGRKVDLWAQMRAGAGYTDDDEDARGLIAIHQEILDGILCELDRYQDRVLDPDTCDEVYLDQMLRDMGSRFGFLELSATDKRRLVRVLIPLLRLKGTETGIEDAIRTLLGIEVDVVPVMSQMIAWSPGLGAGTTSGTFVLMSGSLAKQLQYDILSSVLLTDKQRAQMRRIAAVMRRSICRLRNIVEPDGSPPPAVPLGLGAGRLSIDLILL